jgi:uncharacterized protein with ParB-like and HNH nuclease domain
MSTNTIINDHKITQQQQEEAEKQIREESKIVDYNTITYPLELIVQKFVEGQETDENELFIPDYHRDIAWDEQRQSKFIESILLGLPIPPLYVAEVLDEAKNLVRWELIDGSQRLRTLTRFINNELQLQSLEKLNKLEGFKFSDLPLARQRRLKITPIRIVVLTEKVDKETRINLFERINLGSFQVNE